MVNPGRRSRACDACRARKVRCDEVTPVCGRCVRLGGKCFYTHEHRRFISMNTKTQAAVCQRTTRSSLRASEHGSALIEHHQLSKTFVGGPGCTVIPVAQAERQQRDATNSSACGAFGPSESLTARGPRNTLTNYHQGCEPTQPSMIRQCVWSEPSPSKSDGLARSIISMLSADNLTGKCLLMLGDWPHFVPRAIGHSPLLDHAVQSLLLSTHASRLHDERTLHQAFQHYGKAVSLLGECVRQGPCAITASLLASMKLLECFEITVGVSLAGYWAHRRGSVKCFLSKGPKFLEDDFARSLYHATYGSAANQVQDRSMSLVFETPEWRHVGTGQPPLNATLDPPGRRRRVVTILPRFTGLVRHICKHPEDKVTIETTRRLAQELLAIDWCTAVGIPRGVAMHSTDTTKPPALQYAHHQDALTHLYHWSTKVITSGLFQKLRSHGLLTDILPTLSTLYQEEQQSALLACMSVPTLISLTGAESSPSAGVVAAVMNPLQSIWGALWRLLQRAKTHGTEKAVTRATSLLVWLLERYNDIHAVLGHHLTWEHMVGCTMSWQGGDIPVSKQELWNEIEAFRVSGHDICYFAHYQ